ncbi:hypothetical protein FH608_009390 [Nonomuraea phyllanthi]|uniref:Uncharacterized protein n=1 Tax=Nonomuraea phyllanthi TaxID=2219224 RepID=A0A5C4WQ32_9ACTN|nr:hypothetical protein [Nonomuraea phyllanthi]KAB8195719.1 hypothetical protein FH608_009390 [Nonomuraea phyllanthi]
MKRLVLAWAATAVAATGAALGVLGLLGTGLTGDSGHVLSQAEARSALNTATQRPATTAPTTTPSDAAGDPDDGDDDDRPAEASTTAAPSPTGPGKLIHSVGGTVIASCAGDLVTLRSWSPAQGYSVDGVEPGPAREAKVEFEPDDGEDVKLEISCPAGRPVSRIGS